MECISPSSADSTNWASPPRSSER